MNTNLVSAAVVFGAAFGSMMWLWKIKGGTASKSDEAMRNALKRVRATAPQKAVHPALAKGRTQVIKADS